MYHYPEGDYGIQTRLEVEGRGEFVGYSLFYVREPAPGSETLWERANWELKLVRPASSKRGKAVVVIDVPVGETFDSLSGRFQLDGENRKPLVQYYSPELGSYTPHEDEAGYVDISTDGIEVSGSFEAELSDGGEDLSVSGSFEGLWSLQCLVRGSRGDEGGYIYDRGRESNFCKSFERAPWPHSHH